MNEEKLLTLGDYIRSKNITTEDFSNFTGISAAYLYRFQNKREVNLTTKVINKIYNGTLAKYGVGLEYHEYLNR